MEYFKKNLGYLLETGKLQVKELAAATGLPSNNIRTGDIRFIENWIIISRVSGIPMDLLCFTDIEKREKMASKKIRFLALDVDGTLTDGGMYYTEGGDEFKKFSTLDGMGIKAARSRGIRIGFVSNGKNENLIRRRAELLGVEKVFVGTEDKLPILENWLMEMGIPWESCAYMGDDINDLKIFEKAGATACPSNAVNEVKKNVHIVIPTPGGEGCVREFLDRYIL